MKQRIFLFASIGLLLLALSGAWLAFISEKNQTPDQVFPATINRDCAPWDGPAFTVSIPHADGRIDISIYRSPQIRLPLTIIFPDAGMQEGTAILLLPAGIPEPLSGRVSFQPFKQGTPVEGKFDLTTNSGRRFRGKFIAEWGNETVFCG